MQPSEYEIQREVEALRDIRRRSTAQGGLGTLVIDPDLPTQPTSPTSSLEGPNSPDHSPNNPSDDPFHLFWVPAHVHPEIAPAEFRAFLKEHASDGTAVLQRSNSSASTSSGLGRKKSMLSRQYRPTENDGIENEEILPVRRRSSIYTNGPQLTINDLQKLELLADEASRSDDPSKLRNVLRRSLSLNVSPSVLDEMDELPEMDDGEDNPIIVPPPGLILRRTARTKIRKPGLPGDGGGHRFGSSRRGARSQTSGQTPQPQRTSTSSSSSDHGDTSDGSRPRAFSNESLDDARKMFRPESYSEETSIYDAYASQDDESEELPLVVTSPPPLTVDLPITSPPPEAVPNPVVQSIAPPVVIHQPRPQRYLVPPAQPEQHSPRTPSPEEPRGSLSPPQDSPPSSSQRKDKDKDKKGLFSKWGGGGTTKKTNKERERENRERAEKDKEGGFLSTFFGGGSKKTKVDDSPPLMHSPTAGREAAQALLGASKSYVPSTSPLSPANSYARYPIHVERAIYRLSHIKLANPRRPLYEQVLISNLMFWYLGVINKSPTTTPSGGANAKGDGAADKEKEQREKEQREKEQREKEQKEKEERLKAEKERERIEKEREMELKKKEPPRRGPLTKPLATGSMPGGGRRAEMPIRGPQYEMQHRVIEQEYNGFGGQQGYQPGYNGPVYMGQPPYSAPQVPQGYNPQQGFDDMQFSGSPPGLPINRAASAPPAPMMQPPLQQQQLSPYPEMQRQQQPRLQVQIPNTFYYGSPGLDQQPPPRSNNLPPNLPPGAMSVEHAWLAAQPPPSTGPSLPSSPYPPGRRSRSPPAQRMSPSQNRYAGPDVNPQPTMDQDQAGGVKIPGRSLSVIAQASPVINGKPRKGVSAHAVANGRRPRTADSTPADEDVPLAVWQQQQQRRK